MAERNKRPSFDYSSQSVILPFGDKTLRIMTTDERYMMRCLQLAKNGMQNAKPNPMVGAVIVSGGRLGLQLILAPDDLAKACNGEFADIIM